MACHLPAPNVLGDLQQTKQNTFLLELHLAKKNKKIKKKKQNFKTLNLQPIKSFSMPRYTETKEGSSTTRHWLQTCLGDRDKQDWT
jgi:predicted FMN-binding regulatory protein PaiB